MSSRRRVPAWFEDAKLGIFVHWTLSSVPAFAPDVGTLLADNEIFNSDFAVSLSGTLVPLTAAPFVPEPSTALLLGGGLIALIGVSRRARR